MRTLFILFCLGFCGFQAAAQSFLATKDSSYIDAAGNSRTYNTLVSYNPVTCKDSLIVVINNGQYGQITTYDVAAGPDGQIYLILVGSLISGGLEICLSSLDLQTGNTTCLVDLLASGFPGGPSLVCSADSVLYLAGNGLNSYDLKTGVLTAHGLFPNFYYASGDLIFKNEQLYVTVLGNELLHINIDDVPSSQIVASYTQIPLSRSVFGIASNVYDCDSSDMYLITGVLNPDNSREYDVYGLDFNTQQATFLCTGGGYYYSGSTTFNEFLASDCSVRLHLDQNNSSGAGNGNFQVATCTGGPVFISDTADVGLYSGFRIDSLQLQLSPMLPDESLAAGFLPPSLLVSGQNSPHLTFRNPANVLYPDFLAALRSVYWQYSGAGTPAAGLRTVEVILYARGGRQDTSFALLTLQTAPFAGADTALAVCTASTPFPLSQVLPNDADTAGVWMPALTDTLFHPLTPGSYTFRYVVTGQECPSDTANVNITVLPLPDFSLGNDAAVCSGDTLLLTAPQQASWQDGSTANTFAATQPGVFWAEVTDAAGCVFRDSLAVTFLPLQFSDQLVQLCFGQTYTWNGMAFQSDTTVCATYAAVSGCDSTHCLTLDFFYSTLSADTVICEGQPIDWYGNVYASAGIFSDTALLGGCMTALTLHISVVPADTIPVQAAICPDKPYQLANQTFTAPGIYLIRVPTPAGCDSVLLLTLDQWQVPELTISGDTILCAGSSTTLSAAGFSMYEWSASNTNSPSIQVTGSGVYALTATDAHGCTTEASIDVLLSPAIDADWKADHPTCAQATDGWIELIGMQGGVPPFLYQIGSGALVSEPFFDSLPAAEYIVRVVDAAGCMADSTITLQDPPPLEVNTGGDVVISGGETHQISTLVNGAQGALTYQWTPQAGLSCQDCPNPAATPSDTTAYMLLATDENGCTASDNILVAVLQSDFIFIPNTFSPDGDGQNDYFGVFVNPAKVQAVELLRIYDRWGNLIYETTAAPMNELNKGWNGTFRGKAVSPGVYIWQAAIKLKDGTVIRKSGDVTVTQ